MSGWFRDILAAVVGSKRQNPDSDSTGAASASSTKRTKTASSDAMREIRVRYLYNSRKKITGIDELIMLTVPEGCQTVAALRDILKKRIKNSDYLMWWASKNDEVSSYEESGLDDEVKIPEPQEVPLVIAIPLFTLYFRINGRDIAVKHINPEDDLSTLYSELDKSYKNFKCGELPGMGDLKFERPNIKWSDFHIYQLLNMEGWPGTSEECAIEIGEFWSFEQTLEKTNALEAYANRGNLIKQAEKTECLAQIETYIEDVLRVLDKPDAPAPFLVVENSSGTGKTQLAFCLPRPVLYFVCSMERGAETQAVYRTLFSAFGELSESLLYDVSPTTDINTFPNANILFTTKLKTPYRVCGFLREFLKLASERCDQQSILLNGVDMCQQNVMKVEFRYNKCSVQELRGFYRKLPHHQRPIVIVDEVTTNLNVSLALRNLCRAAYIPVVLMGTNSAIVNFFLDVEVSRGDSYLHGRLVSRLPPFQASSDESNSLINEVSAGLRDLIVRSRPWCASSLLGGSYSPSAPVVQSMIDKVYNSLVLQKRGTTPEKWQQFSSAHSLFCTGLRELNGSKEESTLYLTHHFGRLQRESPLDLWRGHVVQGEGAVVEGWIPHTSFRNLKEDFFLHMALLSYSTELLGGSLHFVDQKRLKLPDMQVSGNIQRWPRLEARTLAGACISSFANGLEGVTFQKFLKYFCYHMSPVNIQIENMLEVSMENLVLPEAVKSWEEQFPFLGIPGPKGDFVYDYWGEVREITELQRIRHRMANLHATENDERIDGRVSLSEEDLTLNRVITFECKNKEDGTTGPFGIDMIKIIVERVQCEETKLAFGILNGKPADFHDKSETMTWLKKFGEEKNAQIVVRSRSEGELPTWKFRTVAKCEKERPSCLVVLIFLEDAPNSS